MPTINKRLDPEEQKPLEWIWRRIIALNYCYAPQGAVERMNKWGDREEWQIDTGYCLDRWSQADFIKRSSADFTR